MRRCEVIIVGGGEHAAVVIDAMLLQPDKFTVMAFVDPKPDAPAARLGLRHIGSEAAALEAAAGRLFIVGIGPTIDRERRRSLVIERLTAGGARFATVVHPSAVVARTAQLADGVVVLANAVVNPGARVGAHSVVNSGAVVEHDVVLGDQVHVAPGACIGGGSRIGEHSYLGLGCRIRDHVELGAHTLVAMGAVVTKSFAESATLSGVPAREVSRG